MRSVCMLHVLQSLLPVWLAVTHNFTAACNMFNSPARGTVSLCAVWNQDRTIWRFLSRDKQNTNTLNKQWKSVEWYHFYAVNLYEKNSWFALSLCDHANDERNFKGSTIFLSLPRQYGLHPFCTSSIRTLGWIFTAGLFMVMFAISLQTQRLPASLLCLTGPEGTLNVHEISFCLYVAFVWASQAEVCMSISMH